MSDQLLAELRAARDNPNVQRYLAMLRRAEGTDKSPDPYRVAGGGKTMLPDLAEFRRVPWNFTQTDGKKNVSTAAGAYQFLQPTWQDIQANLKLRDFGPEAQDLGALFLMRRNGSLADVMEGRFDDAVAKDGRTWASLPSSPYPQRKRSNEFINTALGQTARPTPPAQAAAPPHFDMGDGRVAVPSNTAEQRRLEEIGNTSFSGETKKRMVDLMAAMPKQTATDKALIGDPYPDLFDKELRDLIDMV